LRRANRPQRLCACFASFRNAADGADALQFGTGMLESSAGLRTTEKRLTLSSRPVMSGAAGSALEQAAVFRGDSLTVGTGTRLAARTTQTAIHRYSGLM